MRMVYRMERNPFRNRPLLISFFLMALGSSFLASLPRDVYTGGLRSVARLCISKTLLIILRRRHLHEQEL